MNSGPSERAERKLRPKENRPLPSSKNPHFQNEARCTTLLVKMSSICNRIKNDFFIKGRAPTLVLKQRPGELGNGLLGKPMDLRKFSYDVSIPSNADRPYRL